MNLPVVTGALVGSVAAVVATIGLVVSFFAAVVVFGSVVGATVVTCLSSPDSSLSGFFFATLSLFSAIAASSPSLTVKRRF